MHVDVGPFSVTEQNIVCECSVSVVPLFAKGLGCAHMYVHCLGGVCYCGHSWVSSVQPRSPFFRGNTESGTVGCVDSGHFTSQSVTLSSRNLTLSLTLTQWLPTVVGFTCLRLCASFLGTWTLQHLEEYRTDVWPAWGSWTSITETLVSSHSLGGA